MPKISTSAKFNAFFGAGAETVHWFELEEGILVDFEVWFAGGWISLMRSLYSYWLDEQRTKRGLLNKTLWANKGPVSVFVCHENEMKAVAICVGT